MNCFFIFEGLVTSVETGFSPIVGRTLLMSAGVTLRQPLIATCQSSFSSLIRVKSRTPKTWVALSKTETSVNLWVRSWKHMNVLRCIETIDGTANVFLEYPNEIFWPAEGYSFTSQHRIFCAKTWTWRQPRAAGTRCRCRTCHRTQRTVAPPHLQHPDQDGMLKWWNYWQWMGNGRWLIRSIVEPLYQRLSGSCRQWGLVLVCRRGVVEQSQLVQICLRPGSYHGRHLVKVSMKQNLTFPISTMDGN